MHRYTRTRCARALWMDLRGEDMVLLLRLCNSNLPMRRLQWLSSTRCHLASCTCSLQLARWFCRSPESRRAVLRDNAETP